MVKRQRRRPASAPRQEDRHDERRQLDGTAVAQQVGQFEAATGLAHGPGAIIVAVVAALLIVPVKRAIGAVARRLG